MLYLFRCGDCGREMNIPIKMSDYDLAKNRQSCPACGGMMKRVIEFSGSIGLTGGYDSVGGKASWQ